MPITGTEERDHISLGETSGVHDLEEFGSDLDDSRRDEDVNDNVIVDMSDDDDDDFGFSNNTESTPLHITSTPTKGDQLVPSSVVITPTSTYRSRTSFTRRQLEHLEMLFGETQYPSHQQIIDVAQSQAIESEKSVKLWFQNRRTRLRKMPQLSPVKPVMGDTTASLSSGIVGTSSAARQPRTFSPIVIKPRAGSSASSSSGKSSPSPKPIPRDHTEIPAVEEKCSQPLNVSNSSTESCEDIQPPTKTEVENKDEYKAMTMTTLPSDHPFCKLTHGSSSRPKRKVAKENNMSLQEPPAKMPRREPQFQDPSPPSRIARRRSSQGEMMTLRQQPARAPVPAPNVHTLNQLPVGFVPAWPGSLPIAAPVPVPLLSNQHDKVKSKSHNNNNTNVNVSDDVDAPLDLSKKSEKSEKAKQKVNETEKSESRPIKDNHAPGLPPPTRGLPMVPPTPYYSFPFRGIPSHVHPFAPPTGSVAAPFMVPMYPGALPGMYGNPMGAFYGQTPICSGVQKSS